MARVAATLGAGVPDNIGDGLGVADGSTDAVDVGSGVDVGATWLGSTLWLGVAGGPEVAGVSVGVWVGGGAVGAMAGDGVAVGPDVGSAMTTTESRPLPSVPTTTAWLRIGDCEIDLGVMAMVTGCEFRSATGAQSGWRSAGQTSLTLVTL
jgi:hypothetical protein